MTKKGLDELDEAILRILRFKGRMPYLEIAKRLKVSEGTIRNRVKDMLRKGVIQRFTVETKTNYDFKAIICLKTDSKVPTVEVANEIKTLPFEVSKVFEVTGDWDIICFGEANSRTELNKMIERIRLLPHVVETKSYVVLSAK